MSFSYRDKPRLSERLRGKSGDEILSELEQQLDQDRKMFFETNPNWRSTPMTGPFSRAGFPFDDDMISRGRQDIRSHLDDLAQRHPEFADHLRCPPWGGEIGNTHTFGRKRRGSGSVDDDIQSQASAASSSNTEPPVMQEVEEKARGRTGNLNHHGLRNTVDLGQQQQIEEKQGRGQRSMSAPPDNRTQQPPQRFVSRIEINPVNPADPTSGGGPSTVTSDNHGKPPIAPKQPSQQMPPKQQQSGNVRHIPIFVEGRDEPLLPKVDSENVEQIFSQPDVEQVFPQKQQGFSRPGFTSQHQFYPQQQPQSSRGFQQHRMAPPSPKQQRQAKPSPSPPPQQQQQQQSQQQKPQQSETPPANDPISRVQVVAKQVADLQAQVEEYTGTSRKDKDYIYLDEMLTRNLLKLDDIETEGKENVRLARKEVIKTIQRCISVLEGKVPNPEEENKLAGENESPEQNKTPEENKSEEPMETEPATAENKDNIPEGIMEVATSVEVKDPPAEKEGELKPEDDKVEVEEVKTEQSPMEVEESKQTEPAATDPKDNEVTEEVKSSAQSETEPEVPSEIKSS